MSKPNGPYTLWMDYGYEGWKPTDFATLQEALEADKHLCENWIISRPVSYRVVDTTPADAPREDGA